MKYKSLLKNTKLLAILNYFLTNKEDITYSQYSLLIAMDLVIKYQIIITDDNYDDYFLDNLEIISKNYTSHQDLIIKGNRLLVDLVSKKIKVSTNNSSDKKQILKYIYNKYIVDGYCFHSFPSIYKNEVEENGLSTEIDIKEQNDLKKINYIFNNHNYTNIITRDLNCKTKPIYITDSPAMAYFYAFRSPEYMASLTSTSKYYEYIKDYDKNAFYEKDYIKCKSNLTLLCRHVNMTTKEENTVLKTFDKRWTKLNMTESFPCIAFIKRRDLAKDSLTDIDEIINSVDKIELDILVSKITDSKYPIIRRYTNINSLDLSVVTMPSYREIKNNKFISKKTLQVVLTAKTIEQPKEEQSESQAYVYSYNSGVANTLAIIGLIIGTLALTTSVIFKVIGG